MTQYFTQQNLNLIFNDLRNNSFSPKLLTRILYNNQPPDNTNNNRTNFTTIPYTKHLSERFTSIFQPHNISIAHKPFHLTEHLYNRHKTKIHHLFKSNIIYKIHCNDCNATYTGQTEQYFHKRIQQHKYACNKY